MFLFERMIGKWSQEFIRCQVRETNSHRADFARVTVISKV